MIEALADYLHRSGAALLGNGQPTGPIRVLKTSGAPGFSGRVSFLVFSGDEAHPRLVCHVPRHPSGEERLRREWAVRQQVQARLPSALRATVPMTLVLERLGGMLMLIEQGLPGDAMCLTMGYRRRIGVALDSVAAWLDAFQQATERERREWTVGDEEEHVLHAFAKVAGWLRPDRIGWLADELRKRVRPLRGVEIRWAAQHGDFWPGNILVRPQGLAVVDWEVARLAGPSFVDPLLFAFFSLCGEQLSAGTANGGLSVSHASWLRTAVRRFVTAAICRLSDAPAKLDAAFLVSLLARCQLRPPGERPPVELRALLSALRTPQALAWLNGDVA